MDINNKINIQKTNDKYQYVPKKFIEVAESLEGQFISHMLKQMETTIGSKQGSTAENYYKDLQTSERAKIMVKKSEDGGLKDLILNQIYPENYRNEQMYNAIMKTNSRKSPYGNASGSKDRIWAM